ncbi:MAG TPA: inositol monophosphatase family protein [Candidatus Dependentiae bacterium]|nr:inositol monophosphatase family protein [Candidatus Dependentiae bacterium]HRQ62604.1 inositol monophosphatase family protein [Candidatus Dependentiae bacterium]
MHKKGVLDWQQQLEPIMRAAGDIILSYVPTAQQLTRMPKSGNSFATQADIASEEFLKKELHALLPEASILAEESGSSGTAVLQWVIDPLDGTTNFAQGLSYFCISVALTENNIPIVAAIYQPILNEFFYAEHGKGAWLNGQQINVSTPHVFDDAIVAISLPYLRKQRGPLVDALGSIAKKARAVRHFGAAALDLAYVACGRLDGLFLTYLAWWDVAAGILLIQEAGGQVTDITGKNVTPNYTSCIAGAPVVYQGLIKELKMAGF